MKIQNFFTALILFFAVHLSNASAQEIINDVATMGPGNIDMIFYSLENGAASSIDATTWDISFDTFSMSSTSIRINGAQGSQLFLLGGLETWDDAASVNLEELEVLYNDPTDWGLGAYSQNGDGVFNVGWGLYDVVTHIVTGDKVFILQLPNGEVKKTKIVSLVNNIYTFIHANLDGTSETEVIVDKNNYTNKNSVYYSFESNEVLDLEIDYNDWDFMFCKYIQDLGDEFYYPITGCLINRYATSQKVEGLNDPFYEGTFSPELMSDITSSIGYDWKSYNQNAGSYELVEDRCYFVTTANGAVWRLVFTMYSGSATGEIGMGMILEQASAISVNDFPNTLSKLDVQIYPNPASANDNLTVEVNLTSCYSVTLYNSIGAITSHTLANHSGDNVVLNFTDLQAGLYIVEINNDTSTIRKQLIIQ